VSNEFQEWAVSFSGCDGGDIGSKEHPSIWVCGIEWGGGNTPDDIRDAMKYPENVPPRGYRDLEEQLGYRFNQWAFKLLAAINGQRVEDYGAFAEQAKPFVEGSRGYFKMNLFPIAFKKTDHNLFSGEFSSVTGFASKNDYIQFCKEYRFPQIRSWAQTYVPDLVICTGKGCKDYFSSAFGVTSTFNLEKMQDRPDHINWAVNSWGSLIVVLPFFGNGQFSNEGAQIVGERIADLRKRRV
jgi:hypothetical protein